MTLNRYARQLDNAAATSIPFERRDTSTEGQARRVIAGLRRGYRKFTQHGDEK